ncbi:MAG: phenylalanine--tRNA ligase subunit beta [Aerococcaceae bacterium]|nr:phenylalanine--tRNA ligase subunit beta [Aerococcaceae bacterium]
MKLSREWLSDFLDLSEWSGHTLADRMSRTGIEVEGVENFAEGLSNLVIGQVETVVAHPNSDHLNICQVNTGEETLRQIVCGAPNVIAGAKVITALPGATLPGNITIKKGKLRGEVSEGMLCALQELGFSDSVVPKAYAEGLFLLPEDAPIGADVIDYLKLDDAILELSITPNRADALSMMGSAYEVGAIVEQTPRFEWLDGPLELEAAKQVVQVQVADSMLAPFYQLRVIEDVTIGESPLWLQMRLMKAGIRPINNIVDVTNYCLLLYGQPMHAFDLDQLTAETINVRYAQAGETLTTLDGVERTLTEADIVIADGANPVALAGVMGGLNSEVTPQTRRILLETAVFNPLAIRATSKRFNLRSESSSRFEKGINQAIINQAGEQAALWMAQLGGGKVSPSVAQAGSVATQPTDIIVAYQSIPQKLGITLSQDALVHIFARLGFGVTFAENTFTVSVPPRRWDITIEADILEEIARIYGYDQLPTTLPSVPSTPGKLSAKQTLIRQSRTILEGLGLTQTISYVLTSPKQAELLKSATYPFVKLDFPMSEDRSVLRQSMFPALLEIAKYNKARHNEPLAFYEMGKVFFGQGKNTQPIEQENLALFVSGQKQATSWYAKAQSYDFFEVKGKVEAYLEAVRLSERVRYEAASDIPELHPGRAARIVLDDQAIGVIGQIHPTLTKEYDLDEASFFVEMNLDAILAAKRVPLVQNPIPKYPSTSRDLALLVPQHTEHYDLETVIRKNGGDYLTAVELFDLYEGNSAFVGKKSLAYRVTFQHSERTLTDEDVLSAMNAITAALLQIPNLEIR